MAVITEFLLARIAEDEENTHRYVDVFPHGDLAPLLRRVLVECEAKRRIVEVHPMVSDVVPVHTGPQPTHSCETCHSVTASSIDDVDYVEAIGPCDTLCALAVVYADHPDFDQAWQQW